MLALLVVSACSGGDDGVGDDDVTPEDGALIDASPTDAIADDAPATDASPSDGAMAIDAAGATDAATVPDAGTTQRSWRPAVLIDENACCPELTIDAEGTATAAWYRSVSGITTVSASRKPRGGGWSSPVAVSSVDMWVGGGPAIGADAAGNVIALWGERDGGDAPSGYPLQSVWWRRFTPAGGWGPPARLELDDTLTATDKRLAVAPSGAAVAAWVHTDGIRQDLWASDFLPARGWSTPVQLQVPPQTIISPKVAIDPAGNAMAIWEQSPPHASQREIWVRRFVPGAGWMPGVAIVIPTSTQRVGDSQVAMDAAGNAIAVWTSEDSSTKPMRVSVWARRYTSAGWGPATRLDDTTYEGYLGHAGPQIAIGPSGTAMAIWLERMPGPDTSYGLWARRFTGEAWSAPTTIDTAIEQHLLPQIAIDADDNAIAVWKKVDAQIGGHIRARRFEPATGWSDSVVLSRPGVPQGWAKIVIDRFGDAVVVWFESENQRLMAAECR